MEWEKPTLLFISIVISIGGLIGFIVSLAPIYLYIITIGVMVFVIRHFHDGKRVIVSMKYVKVMGLLLILQFFMIIFLFYILTLFGFFISPQDWVFAFILSLFILIHFIRQVYSDLGPFSIFGSTYDTFTLTLIGILIFIFLVFLYIGIAATFNL
ncbi:hypothetical protein [Methanobacterium sp. ACI-7]|uniref:hypothetical protein n=1 Tax=unclassified Methanobacterium TaxID=2627676 RepID=UPI0039C3A82E